MALSPPGLAKNPVKSMICGVFCFSTIKSTIKRPSIGTFARSTEPVCCKAQDVVLFRSLRGTSSACMMSCTWLFRERSPCKRSDANRLLTLSEISSWRFGTRPCSNTHRVCPPSRNYSRLKLSRKSAGTPMNCAIQCRGRTSVRGSKRRA